MKLLLMKYMLFRTLAPETKQFSRCFLDTARISAYAQQIKRLVDQSSVCMPPKPVHVLDCGEGWGILAMVAATLGVASATRVESLRPIIAALQDTVELNDLEDIVEVVGREKIP
jgi:ribosomal protein L11 methylase PrmA